MAENQNQENLKEDWKNIGEGIASTVQNAVSSGDYTQLSREISELMNRAVDTAGRTISAASMYAGQQAAKASDSMTQSQANGYRNNVTSNQNYAHTQTAQYIHNINTQRYQNAVQGYPQAPAYQQQRAVQYRRPGWNRMLYAKPDGAKIGGILGSIAGYMMCLLNLLMTLAYVSISIPEAAIFTFIFSLTMLTCGILCNRKVLQTDRFDRYLRVLQDKTYAAIDELAQTTGKDRDYTRKDVGKMIGRGWFRQGHIDDEGMTLITSHETYAQYRQMKQGQQQIAEQKAEEEGNYTPAQREILTQCSEYIEQIRLCNDRIPGEVISTKLDRLERTARVIMERVKTDPSLAGSLRRLSTYYLPTTVKLLNAYADLDRQEKSSENIEKSKREIESAIDAMNDGFDKLYDSMFDATNLDISTDVEVMRTLLEQEGLTGSNFSSNTVMNGTE